MSFNRTRGFDDLPCLSESFFKKKGKKGRKMV